ncbi:GntR family transcriptional regulator [Faecalicoccus pleomorphus]|uniref:GntR family transcriptional regulator n=1 Tax=Faecalicoccus pleomorphus TaxID=1323 RepID=UPI00232B8530|nr:GntR family transcriptional regulator [Faecalicoccus pleomorphus]MDB7988660.1 GntR family transcriptional regulator [Faecalicoccus pleomorphus]MDB7992924.1 GntR family transcriptional regulator [Faecalicoccus pleomorphus]
MPRETTSKKQIIVKYLISQIHDGQLKVGDLIPSENELVEKFHFSRQTIHNALSDLAIQGVITRHPGKGSYVSQRSVNRNIQKKMSFTEDMESIGMKAGSQLLEFKVLYGKDVPEIAKILDLENGEMIYFLSRLRTGDGTPIAIQDSYMPAKHFKDLDLNLLIVSLEAYVEKKGMKIEGFVTKLKAVEGTQKQLKLLRATSNALLQSTSIRYLDKNTPVHYTCSLYRSDLFEYTFSSFV